MAPPSIIRAACAEPPPGCGIRLSTHARPEHTRVHLKTKMRATSKSSQIKETSL